MFSSALLSRPFSVAVDLELLRVEVLESRPDRRASLLDTSTRRSILPPPPLLQALMQIPEGPVLPALRRFRGVKSLCGGRMPPPK